MEACHCLPIFAHVLALSIQYEGVVVYSETTVGTRTRRVNDRVTVYRDIVSILWGILGAEVAERPDTKQPVYCPRRAGVAIYSFISFQVWFALAKCTLTLHTKPLFKIYI